MSFLSTQPSPQAFREPKLPPLTRQLQLLSPSLCWEPLKIHTILQHTKISRNWQDQEKGKLKKEKKIEHSFYLSKAAWMCGSV